MAAKPTTPKIASSTRPTTGTQIFNAFEPTAGSAGSPSWQKAYDLASNYQQQTVNQGRQVAQEAASTKSYYEGLQQNRDFTFQQTQQANQNNPSTQMQSNFDKAMSSNASGGQLAFSGTGNTYNPSTSDSVQGQAARASWELGANQRQLNMYNNKAATDNYYSAQNRASDQSYQSQMAGNERAWKTQQSNEDRDFQRQQSALDRAQQQKLALLDSQTKIQSSLLNSLSVGGGGGYHFW